MNIVRTWVSLTVADLPKVMDIMINDTLKKLEQRRRLMCDPERLKPYVHVIETPKALRIIAGLRPAGGIAEQWEIVLTEALQSRMPTPSLRITRKRR